MFSSTKAILVATFVSLLLLGAVALADHFAADNDCRRSTYNFSYQNVKRVADIDKATDYNVFAIYVLNLFFLLLPYGWWPIFKICSKCCNTSDKCRDIPMMVFHVFSCVFIIYLISLFLTKPFQHSFFWGLQVMMETLLTGKVQTLMDTVVIIPDKGVQTSYLLCELPKFKIYNLVLTLTYCLLVINIVVRLIQTILQAFDIEMACLIRGKIRSSKKKNTRLQLKLNKCKEHSEDSKV